MTDDAYMLIIQIESCIRNSKEAGHNPVIILINDELVRSIYKTYGVGVYIGVPEHMTLLGLDVKVTGKIPDFQVIDDRSWVYTSNAKEPAP